VVDGRRSVSLRCAAADTCDDERFSARPEFCCEPMELVRPGLGRAMMGQLGNGPSRSREDRVEDPSRCVPGSVQSKPS
jgi:hypothetical protein